MKIFGIPIEIDFGMSEETRIALTDNETLIEEYRELYEASGGDEEDEYTPEQNDAYEKRIQVYDELRSTRDIRNPLKRRHHGKTSSHEQVAEEYRKALEVWDTVESEADTDVSPDPEHINEFDCGVHRWTPLSEFQEHASHWLNW